MTLLNQAEWVRFLAMQPNVHLLQSGAWGELKSRFGWDVARIADGKCGVQLLFRRLPLGLTIAYIPYGPIGTDWQTLIPEIDALCRSKRAVFLKVEPDEWEPVSSITIANLSGFEPSAAIQPRRTIVISLTGNEDEWMARMRQKCRYNIRLAQRSEILVHESTDIPAFYQLIMETGNRDGFGVHSQAYYQQAYDLFSKNGQVALLMASYQGELLAGLMVFASGDRAWYLYGASSDKERQRMPAYLLQWEAMRWAAQHGCCSYDLWGVPDEDEAILEAQFSERSDGLWGVYRFKRGFGGEVKRTVGGFDRVYQPLFYRLYRIWSARRGGDSA